MQLQRYLDRIAFARPTAPDLATLQALHRAHALSIPYENIDVQLGRAVTRAPERAFEKIVMKRRGGWCYEMNGLFAAALEAIGFRVRRLAGAVMREALGAAAVGNHLVVLVDLDDETWLCDVGFGDGLIAPTPLAVGPIRVGHFHCAIEQTDDGWWRYRNDPAGGAPGFDFHEDVADESLLETQCRRLQSEPDSPFVQNLVVQRWENDRHVSLRGRVLQELSASGRSRRLIGDADELVDVLQRRFGLDTPETTALWPAILSRHEAVFRDAPFTSD